MILYIVATPIGNLEDISKRALRVLKEADLVLCEDTTRTSKLLHHFGIETPRESYHQHSRLKKKKKILSLLKHGKDLALVSDAGTPGVSDPGGELIEFLKKRLPGLKVSPIPGPSAITALASVSGFPMNKFLFLGYPPKKNKRVEFFKEAGTAPHSVIFFEAPYRVLRSLKDLREEVGRKRRVVVGRELTKKHQRIYRGAVDEVIKKLQYEKTPKGSVKGEFTIAVKGKNYA